MRVIVCGSRDFVIAQGIESTSDIIGTVMEGIANNFMDSVTIVHGDSGNADKEAGACAAVAEELSVEPHPALWEAPCRETCNPGHRRDRGGISICPAAGVYRNQEMLDAGAQLVIAFSEQPVSRGARDMIRRAKEAGVPVWVVGHG